MLEAPRELVHDEAFNVGRAERRIKELMAAGKVDEMLRRIATVS